MNHVQGDYFKIIKKLLQLADHIKAFVDVNLRGYPYISFLASCYEEKHSLYQTDIKTEKSTVKENIIQIEVILVIGENVSK